MTVRCYIALGANLEQPIRQLQQAIDALRQLPQCQWQGCSSFYRSAPMGPQDQPDYVNAVAALDTTLTAHALLDATQAIELAHGRVRKAQRWGPRTLDLDILLYGTDRISDERLTIPHYGMTTRNFVLYPLYELAPDCQLPDGTPIEALLAKCPEQDLQRITR